MDKEIIQILEQKGPLLSGELISELVERKGIKNGSARNLIQGIEPPVFSLKRINFHNNQKLFYLDSQKTSLNWKKWLQRAMEKGNKTFDFALRAIEKEGIMPKVAFPAKSGSSSNKDDPAYYDRVVDKLIELKLVKIVNSSSGKKSSQQLPVKTLKKS